MPRIITWRKPRHSPRGDGGRDAIRTQLDAVRADFENLQQASAALSEQAGGAVAEGYRTAMRAAQSVAERALALAERKAERNASDMDEAYTAAREGLSDWTDVYARKVGGAVKEQPGRSILVSLGAGAVLGALISRL